MPHCSRTPSQALLLAIAASVTIWAQMRAPEPLSGDRRESTDDRISNASRALAVHPNNNPAACRLALAYIQKMRETVNFDYLNLATKLIDGVLERDPGNYEALRLRTEVAMERHEFRLVRDFAIEMTRFAPNDPGAWGSLGDASMELGEYRQAGDAYARMLALRPDLASYNRVAWHRFVTGDAPGAIALMKAAIVAGNAPAENLAWCWAELGGMFWKTGKVSAAEDAYKQALTVVPRYYPALAGIGRIAAARGSIQTAVAAYKGAQDTVPLPEFAGALEALFRRAGDWKSAKEQRALLDAIELTMRVSGERTNRAMVLLLADQNRNLQRALELAQAEAKVRPDVYSHDALAWVLFRLGRFKEADLAAGVALSLVTPEPAFHFHAAMIADALGDSKRAQQQFESALALNPVWDFAQAGLAREKLAALQRTNRAVDASISSGKSSNHVAQVGFVSERR